MMDALLLLLIFILFWVPFAVAGLWEWVIVLSVIAIIVGVVEGVVYLVRNRTLSQLFWAWGDRHPVGKWLVCGSATIGWLILMAHLLI